MMNHFFGDYQTDNFTYCDPFVNNRFHGTKAELFVHYNHTTNEKYQYHGDFQQGHFHGIGKLEIEYAGGNGGRNNDNEESTSSLVLDSSFIDDNKNIQHQQHTTTKEEEYRCEFVNGLPHGKGCYKEYYYDNNSQKNNTKETIISDYMNDHYADYFDNNENQNQENNNNEKGSN